MLSNAKQIQHSRMMSIAKEPSGKRMLSTSIFGGLGMEKQKVYEISSYKRDAANLLANRIIKKFRGYFVILQDFAAF